MNPVSTSIVGIDTARPLPGVALLDDETRTRALALLREIVAAIPGAENVSPAVADGAAGHALFFAYAALCEGIPAPMRDDLLSNATVQLQSAASRIHDLGHSPFLYQGFTGVAWSANHLRLLGLLED